MHVISADEDLERRQASSPHSEVVIINSLRDQRDFQAKKSNESNV